MRHATLSPSRRRDADGWQLVAAMACMDGALRLDGQLLDYGARIPS